MEVSEFHKVFFKAGKVCTDSRKVFPGSIFFALKGENFDGNKYAAEALQKGCSLAVVDNPELKNIENFLYVPDVLTFLQELAKYHREQFSLDVLAVTGTNGKTTTKELIAAVLGKNYKIVATRGNLNNHIGVPLTLLEINDNTQIAIVEMGANHTSEIEFLCEIARPGYGLITNIGSAHLEGFGSPEKVREAKNELYNYIRNNKGTIFLNIDDQVLISLSKNIRTVTYGKGQGAEIQGFDPGEVFSAVNWGNPPENENGILIITQLVGGYNFYNIMAAICIGRYFGISRQDIKYALEQYNPGMNRSQYIVTAKNRIILDAYNANPDSMKAAIESFKNFESDKKLAIIGDMFELGEFSRAAHLDIYRKLQESSIKGIFLVGPEFSGIAGKSAGKFFNDTESLTVYLQDNPVNDHLVLIKGSRAMGMERLVPYL